MLLFYQFTTAQYFKIITTIIIDQWYNAASSVTLLLIHINLRVLLRHEKGPTHVTTIITNQLLIFAEGYLIMTLPPPTRKQKDTNSIIVSIYDSRFYHFLPYEENRLLNSFDGYFSAEIKSWHILLASFVRQAQLAHAWQHPQHCWSC